MSHPIKDILRAAGYSLSDSGDYWRTSAKFRGGSAPTSIAIDKRTGNFKDFGAGTGWRSPEILAELISGQRVDFSNYEIEPEVEKLKTVKVYPKEILKRLLPHFDLFKKRGISEATLREFEGGMAHSGKMNKRVIFPIYDRHNRIVGFAGRWFMETPFGLTPKWKLLGDKVSWLYPSHLNDTLLREKQEIIIVESVGDVLALWDAGIKNVMCIFGTSLSAKQLSYIIGLDPKRIIIATNNDQDNDEQGQKAAARILLKLRKHFDTTYLGIHLPTRKDFGAMNKGEIHAWYDDIP